MSSINIFYYHLFILIGINLEIRYYYLGITMLLLLTAKDIDINSLKNLNTFKLFN